MTVGEICVFFSFFWGILMKASEKFDHKIYIFSGRVQGVGFRWTTLKCAEQYPVVGYVYNNPDGSVKVEVEGAKIQIDNFIAKLKDTMAQNISSCTCESAPMVGYTSFEVRY
mgnify:FL=1